MNTRTNICFVSKFEIHAKTWLRLMSATLISCKDDRYEMSTVYLSKGSNQVITSNKLICNRN